MVQKYQWFILHIIIDEEIYNITYLKFLKYFVTR